MSKAFCILFVTSIAGISPIFSATTNLIKSGATWKYLDDGSDQGIGWTSPSFNDASWLSGKSQLGYGDGDEATIVGYGPDPNLKYITTYFRKAFSVNNASSVLSLSLSLLRDDGAVVYLNGTEVYRNNMPAGTVTYATLATDAIAGSAESAFLTTAISPSLLVNGTNVIAVEIHQSSQTSSDISFNLTLSATVPDPCTAPSGLNATNITATSATLNWIAVAAATNYVVRHRLFGTTTWTNSASATNSKNLTGLAPFTQYEYQVQTVCGTSSSGYSALANFTTLLSTDTLIYAGNSWKYLDNGSNQGTAWRSVFFNDANWNTGNAELGYGDGDEATTVSYGPNAANKYITTYFRKTFSVANPAAYNSLNLFIVRDDGAVVYINGTEVYRSNMPTGIITYTTLASSSIGAPDESAYYSTAVPAAVLRAGTNVVAVEVHQGAVNSSDLSFKMRLAATPTVIPVVLKRGPYLQIATPTSIIIRWRTDVLSDSRVRYGLSAAALTNSVYYSAPVSEHEIKLTGLTPSTRYYYSIGTSATTLQGDANNFFITPPNVGTVKPTRIWVIGDAGSNYAEQNQVRDAYYHYTGSTYTDLWLWLGDNAYNSGTDAEYQTNVFINHYEQMFKQTVVWPAAGNHDLISANATNQTGPYYDIFTLPRKGEAGGIASNTEAYYSYNYANIHFIVLESTTATFRAIGNGMAAWLASDLSANTQRWTIAYWHHPPYSKGSHNSDTEAELVEMRQNIIPILESYKVDLVLCGHSHAYERSFLINGHYGTESTFNSSMIVAGGSGAMPYPYVKSDAGCVYAVVG
ncbi:MAG TPA: fibronectin type III domain-containing protein, partial [Chitinophagales bacterium]|nr:fibronectin type III domain-containing protein [Chitinophagales bacterium]